MALLPNLSDNGDEPQVQQVSAPARISISSTDGQVEGYAASASVANTQSRRLLSFVPLSISITPARLLSHEQSVNVTRNIEKGVRYFNDRVFSSKIRPYHTPSLRSMSGNHSASYFPPNYEGISSSTQLEPPNVFSPRLPSELWLQILLRAARDERDVIITGSHYTDPHSFLEFVPAHSHLPERLTRYKAWLRWKASLTTVCSLFHAIVQEVLYEDVWITGSKGGRRLAERLGGSPDTTMAKISSTVDRRPPKQVPKLSWGRLKESKPKKKRIPVTIFSQFPPVRRSPHNSTHKFQKSDPGRFIRRLRIETSAMDQCSPHDLLLILQHCPGLLVFEDCRSIRRPVHPLIITSSEVIPFDIVVGEREPDTSVAPPLTTDVLAHTILSRPLKRVTWTNYAHDGGNFDKGVRVYGQVLGPFLEKAGRDLEVLEIITSTGGMSMGSEEEGTWLVAGAGGSDARGCEPPARPLNGLKSESVITSQFVSMNLSGLSGSLTGFPNHHEPSITLPCLESLKATLDNVTFSILSMWTMPSLRNLSVVSPDFTNGLEGFRRFLEAHGDGIQQLELGHSNGELEEFWVTQQSNERRQRSRMRLNVWCPNLKEFICSADAEWNWESPDWIAPHVLLPAHPGLEFIGVRGLEKRLVNDAEEFRRTSSVAEYPYFMLLQQFSSMLRVEAFPSLRLVRDLSWESDRIRRTGELRGSSKTSVVPRRPSSIRPLVASPSFPFLRPNRLVASQSKSKEKNVLSLHVLRFWDEALEKCKKRNVLVENYQGVALTIDDRTSFEENSSY